MLKAKELTVCDNPKMNADHYLDYLEKEMHIMGVLSTFCLAVPSIILERISSTEEKSIAYTYLTALVKNGLATFIIASLLMFLGAMFFYLQRSRLAWFYGQISLEIAIPGYTGRNLNNRLKTADSWVTWIPYHWAKSAILFAVAGYVCSGLSVYSLFIARYNINISLIVCGLLSLSMLWIRRNSIKYNYHHTFYVPIIG